jgi:hypothetical protein
VFGEYVIERGSYAMNLFGAIKKKFGVRAGSTITLNGRPEEAVLDLTAVYEVETSVEPLLADNAANADLRSAQEVPVQVLINIDGNTEELNIGFDIAVPKRATRQSTPKSRTSSTRSGRTKTNSTSRRSA